MTSPSSVHTLELPESEMSAGTFSVTQLAPGRIRLRHPDPEERHDARRRFLGPLPRTRLPGARRSARSTQLVFVNMAPLYPGRMGEYLYLLGRWLLEVATLATDGAHRGEMFTRGLN